YPHPFYIAQRIAPTLASTASRSHIASCAWSIAPTVPAPKAFRTYRSSRSIPIHTSGPTCLAEPAFSEHSYGFRPGRSAHQAVEAAPKYIAGGDRWVVDLGSGEILRPGEPRQIARPPAG